MKVLIVDDSHLLRNRVRDLLLKVNSVLEIEEAVNAMDAKKKIRTFKPEIAILDIRMPGGSGIELIPIVKESNKNAKVIMLSNYNNQQYIAKAEKEGADVFLSKVEEFEKLLPVVTEFSGGQREKSVTVD
ncbi:MAG: response regulator transcription factor [Melioribacteraceae bacterium]|nr:response regulator transcription factor [Melioribacteraceae bacterium]MCO6473580.1 response regulator transcription factor [Melioribacteraceae bacterium]MDD3558389.1 response regulator transcription factor [Melioribacteraceae bacterium]